MSGNQMAAWIISVAVVLIATLCVRGLLRGRQWRGDGTWLMVTLVAMVGAFAVFGSFATAGIQDQGQDCRDRGGRLVRYLGCVDPATNAPR